MTAADQILAIRQNEPGKSPAAIADELKVSRQFVSKVLKGAGQTSDFRAVLPRRSPRNAVKPFAQRSEFGQTLDLLGMSNDDAAKFLGVHPVTVSKYATGATEAPEGVQLLLLAALGLGLDTTRAAIAAGRRKLKAAVDTAQAEA